MAFKGPIDFDDGRKLSTDIASAFGSGLAITGVHETAGNFRDFSKLALFMTGFTSKRVALAVFKKSQRHVPYDTGELFDSGYVSYAGYTSERTDNPTVIDENIEGTVAAYVKGLAVRGMFTGASGFFAVRQFTNYSVGYTADHAVLIHENPPTASSPTGMQFRQDTKSPFRDLKTDHFLLNSYHAYKHRFSAAMLIGMKGVEDAIAAIAAKQATALSSGAGKPRLVRR